MVFPPNPVVCLRGVGRGGGGTVVWYSHLIQLCVCGGGGGGIVLWDSHLIQLCVCGEYCCVGFPPNPVVCLGGRGVLLCGIPT